jgi:hypothetical protein
MRNLTINDKIKELEYFYSEDFHTKTDNEINTRFNLHIKENSEEVKISSIYNENDIKNDILISTPDGFQQLGDLIIKTKRDIHEINLNDNKKLKCSLDHLIETSKGWVKAKNIKAGDSILTVDGFINCKSNKVISNDIVYDFEVLHENHRYWAGDGISSHNTGKTYLLLNAIRNAIDMGYYIIFYDSENAVDKALMEKFDIDTSKVRYEPVSTIQEFRHHITSLIDQLVQKKREGIKIPKLFFALDSAGSLPSKKEVDDAISGSEKADMTRAKLTKSLFRIITVPLAEIKAPFVFTNHTYQCLGKGAEVLLSDGSSKEIQNIKVGDIVQTLNGNKPVIDTTEYENVKTYTLELEDGTKLTGTENHRFLVKEEWRKDTSWKRLDELKKNDILLKIEANSEYTYKRQKIKSDLKIKSIKENIKKEFVYDISVKDSEHYILKNGLISHNTQSFISLTKAGGGCLIPGSKVIMGDNSHKSIEDIRKGDKVMTLEGSKEILDTWKFDKPVIEVEFEDGSVITCSEDHRFFTGGDYLNDDNWLRAKNLVSGDEVIQSKYLFKYLNLTKLKDLNLTKLKVKSVKKLGITKVNDLTVKDTQHYITKNGVINHNTGPEYSASIILFLGKAQLTEGSGKNKVKSGIIVKVAPNKNRFAKPNVVKTYIRYDSGMNPYVGLEEYFDWDTVGVSKGEMDKDGNINIKQKCQSWVCKHLDEPIKKAKELYSDKVFTKEVLDAIDKRIQPIFNYGINDEIPDDILGEDDEIIDLLDEVEEEAADAIDDIKKEKKDTKK